MRSPTGPTAIHAAVFSDVSRSAVQKATSSPPPLPGDIRWRNRRHRPEEHAVRNRVPHAEYPSFAVPFTSSTASTRSSSSTSSSSCSSSTSPSARRTIKHFPYGWSFQTAEDLEELLAVFVGFPPSSKEMKDPSPCTLVGMEPQGWDSSFPPSMLTATSLACVSGSSCHEVSSFHALSTFPREVSNVSPRSGSSSCSSLSASFRSEHQREGRGVSAWAASVPRGNDRGFHGRRRSRPHHTSRVAADGSRDGGVRGDIKPQRPQKLLLPRDSQWLWSPHLLLTRRRVQERRHHMSLSSPPSSSSSGSTKETTGGAFAASSCAESQWFSSSAVPITSSDERRVTTHHKHDPPRGNWDDEWSKVVAPLLLELMNAIHFPSLICE